MSKFMVLEELNVAMVRTGDYRQALYENRAVLGTAIAEAREELKASGQFYRGTKRYYIDGIEAALSDVTHPPA